MNRLSPIDLIFLLLENQTRPMHMSSCLIFDVPAGRKTTFVAKVIEALRSVEVGRPFNQKLKWLEGGVAHWAPAAPDMDYHVRHVAIPGPGTMAQLDDTLALLNTPLLDRAYPLWQSFVIEGLEHGRFALFTKLHHSMIDGEGAFKLLRAALSDDPGDNKLGAIWEASGKPPRKQPVAVSQSQLERLRSQASSLPTGLKDITSGLLNLGAQALKLKPQQSSLPFQAPDTPFNAHLSSSARCYANCELPLDTFKAIASAGSCTVNDVALACIDDALHKYLAEMGKQVDSPLVAAMPLSTRTKGEEASGNQVTADLVQMGQPGATVSQRLQQIHDSTGRVKDKARSMSAPMRQVHALLLMGLTTVPDITPGVTAAPSSNVLISNMVGPQEQLYMGGAPLRSMHGLPILPPSPCLNVTFASILGDICLAVASTPEAMSNPGRYIELLRESFTELEQAVVGTRPARKQAVRKKAVRKKAAPRKAVPKKTTKKTTKKQPAAKKTAGRR